MTAEGRLFRECLLLSRLKRPSTAVSNTTLSDVLRARRGNGLAVPGGDRVQVFGPGHPYFERFQGSGPVPLFEVDDVDLARRELEAAGIEVLGPTESDDMWRWINVRGPDGNRYELGSRTSTSQDLDFADREVSDNIDRWR